MYDYKGQRSDELTMFAGETILLLYKDSDLWWMGEKEDGEQGFFPANYVTLTEEEEEEDDMRKSVSFFFSLIHQSVVTGTLSQSTA